MPITYMKGDATYPEGPGHKVIIHCCNDMGAWGRGFVLALDKRWSIPKRTYKSLFGEPRGTVEDKPPLGLVQLCEVEQDTTVANLIGQSGIAHKGQTVAPVRYSAIRQGIRYLSEIHSELRERHHNGVSYHMPRIGCGLAGGVWSLMEKSVLLKEEFKEMDFFVYDLP